jgi:hypothetical protein
MRLGGANTIFFTCYAYISETPANLEEWACIISHVPARFSRTSSRRSFCAIQREAHAPLFARISSSKPIVRRSLFTFASAITRPAGSTPARSQMRYTSSKGAHKYASARIAEDNILIHKKVFRIGVDEMTRDNLLFDSNAVINYQLSLILNNVEATRFM